MITEDQLKAMEASAPLLVAEYRKLAKLADEFCQASNEVVADSDRCTREDRGKWLQTQWRLEEYLGVH